MTYDEFKDYVADNIKDFLNESYENATVDIKQVVKNNNQELDGLDIFSTHLYFSQNGEIAAYLRIVPPGKRFEEVSFGRIFTSLPYRGKGLGAKLMEEGIKAAEKIYGKCPIRISAQKHACGFYEKFGFIKDSEEYDEDGIVHIEMIRK